MTKTKIEVTSVEFEVAIQAAKHGCTITRMYWPITRAVYFQKGHEEEIKNMSESFKHCMKDSSLQTGQEIYINDCFALYENSLVTYGWTPSMEDIQANDWLIFAKQEEM
jgi:hypothetical protein